MVNTPIPHSLKSEAKKAAKILREFSMPSAKAGPDSLIPAGILAKAKGLAILTVVKAGFLVTARGGSGIVIARLDDADEDSYCAGWSAPTAIGIAGLGGGFEIGAEVTDFVIILNKRSAVEAFSKGGNLTLGGNFTIAAGPLGRNIEGDVSVRSPAAVYTYSKTKGIFAGISIEGSGLIERKDANRKFYGQGIRAHQILSGEVDPPEECEALYTVLRHHREYAMRAALQIAKEQAYKHRHTIKDKVTQGIAAKLGRSGDKKGSPEPHRRSSESLVMMEKSDKVMRTYSQKTVTRTSKTIVTSSSGSKPFGHSPPSPSSRKPSSFSSTSSSTLSSGGDWGSVARRGSSHTPSKEVGDKSGGDKSGGSEWANLMAVAEHSYTGHLPCYLSFGAGDKIEVLTRTDKQFDWWEGTVHGKIGIFPANYVRVL